MTIGNRDRDRLGAGASQGSRGAHFRPVGSADACGCAGEPTQGSAPVRRGGQRPLKRAMIVAVAVLAMCGAGGAVAWFGVQDNVINTFTRGEIKPSIEEAFDASSTVKENVFVKNEGTAPAYMRAAVSVYWEDLDGDQLWETPAENVDYTITWGSAISESANPHWILGDDGYYYWSVPVEAGGTTSNLINSVEKKGDHGDKRLVVDIATQALQANLSASEGFDAVWSASSGLAVGADGTLVQKTTN